VHVVDVSDIERPRKVAEYSVPDMGSHNMWVEDDVMYIGYYEGGLRAVDVAGELRGDLMAQGRELGSVWTGSPRGYRPNLPMAWGAQPHKGMIYVSDINSGFWVAKLTEAPQTDEKDAQAHRSQTQRLRLVLASLSVCESLLLPQKLTP
jgi:hypothetical protein